MKHSVKITLILISMFFFTQFIGIFVANVYAPDVIQVVNETTGEITSQSQYNLPYGLDPPEDLEPKTSAISIIIAMAIAVTLMLTLMKLKAETFLRIWFLIVVILGIALGLNAFLIKIPYSTIIALIVAVPLGLIKIFQRNMIVHNLTEIIIYPGIASVFIPILNIPVMIFLLIAISFYDMYAVWHAGFMQKMAKYQIEQLKIFSGFFVPYLGKKERQKVKANKAKGKKQTKVRVNLAILGGGDVVFPILLAGVVLNSWGLIPALIIPFGAVAGLSYLFYKSEKGKFYPAMPFISVGCFIALAIAYLIA
jgi:presenilin-like A22 family membrane protease